MSPAADRDEQAELRVLREATARSAAEAADTVGVLAGRARTTTGRARETVDRARTTARRLRRPVLLAGLPAAVVLIRASLLLRRFRDRLPRCAGYRTTPVTALPRPAR